MKVGASVKKICKDCYIIVRKRVVMCRCKNPVTAGKHKQRQG